MRILTIVISSIVAVLMWTSSAYVAERAIPAQFADKQMFADAISTAPAFQAKKGERVTGITVPHHLLAADLIARGFAVASAFEYDKIILLSPEHFYKARRPFATTLRNFETVFGEIAVHREDVTRLLGAKEIFERSDLFENEHGFGALLPFLKSYLPSTPVVPIAISVNSREEHWKKVIALLTPLITPRTLIVQSTDYSHYLDWPTAVQRDQETLNVITAGLTEQVPRLGQPTHLDSMAAQYIQMMLQKESFGASSIVIANRNSAEYSVATQDRSTSYIVSIFTNTPALGSRLNFDDQEITFFGGDFFPGRYLLSQLENEKVRSEIVERVLAITQGRPLVVNLETALLRAPPPGIDENLHFAHADLAVPLMKALNVRAAGLANNHANDLGQIAYDETVSILNEAGIVPLGHMEPHAVGELGVVALNFIGAGDYRGYPVVARTNELERVCNMDARSPLVAFVHWGAEYTRKAAAAELSAAQAMHTCGVGLIIGHHSHQVAERVRVLQGGAYQVVFSLGNFLFDQTSERASGGLLEVRTFRQGTYATRLIPLENYYETALAARQAIDAQREKTVVPIEGDGLAPITTPEPQNSADFRTQRGQK